MIIDKPLRAAPRQLQVLSLLALGRTDAEIAREIGISVPTVRTYLGRLYRENGFHNRTEAVAAWLGFQQANAEDRDYARTLGA